jgi:threonine synthase
MAKWSEADQPVIAVPSGNFGNLCAGLVAQQAGLPVQHFIAACNANRVFTNYLESGKYLPVSSVSTISNAMDVGNPSNFTRIQEMFKGREAELREKISSFSISDTLTRKTIRSAADKLDYIMDPHTAVAYAALEEWKTKNGKKPGIILGTAHPVKFPDVVEEEIQKKIILPEGLNGIMEKVKYAELISPDYQTLRNKIASLKQ